MSIDAVERTSPHEPVDDGKPLLGKGPSSTGDARTLFVSSLTAHRRRLRAFTQVLWDSGISCVCGAAAVFSIAALFVKTIGDRVPVFEIVAFRSVLSFLVCAAYARAAGISPLFGHRATLPFLVSRGLFGASAMTTYYFSIKMLPLADAVTIFFLNPAITAVAAWAIMKEPLGLRGVAGVIISLGGLVLLTRPPFIFGETGGSGGSTTASGGDGLHSDGASDGDRQRLLGTMFGLMSAILSTGAFISIRFIGKAETALVVSVYFHVCAAGTSVVPLAAGLPRRAVLPSGSEWALLLGVACCSFWGQILIGRGFQLLTAARASAINLTQVVYSYILGLLFLHESLTLLGAAGSLLIGAGAMLSNLKPKAATGTAAAIGSAAPAAATTFASSGKAAATTAAGGADGGGGCDGAADPGVAPSGMCTAVGAASIGATANDRATDVDGGCTAAAPLAPAAVAVVVDLAVSGTSSGHRYDDGGGGNAVSDGAGAQSSARESLAGMRSARPRGGDGDDRDAGLCRAGGWLAEGDRDLERQRLLPTASLQEEYSFRPWSVGRWVEADKGQGQGCEGLGLGSQLGGPAAGDGWEAPGGCDGAATGGKVRHYPNHQHPPAQASVDLNPSWYEDSEHRSGTQSAPALPTMAAAGQGQVRAMVGLLQRHSVEPDPHAGIAEQTAVAALPILDGGGGCARALSREEGRGAMRPALQGEEGRGAMRPALQGETSLSALSWTAPPQRQDGLGLGDTVPNL